MVLLGQKHADMFKFAIFGRSSVRNYELLKISVFGKNVKKTTTWQKIRTVWPQACGKKLRATVNLHKLPQKVRNVQAIFELAIFLQNNVLNYELLKIIVFCQKREENNKRTKYSHFLTWRLRYKGRATINLPKLVCVVYNIQRTSICCFRYNLCKKACAIVLSFWIGPKSHCQLLFFGRNWRQNNLCNFRFAWNWRLVLNR